GSYQSEHHSCTFSHMSNRPYPLGADVATGSGPSFHRAAYAARDANGSSPHGNSRCSSPPRAANSHSASLGSRTGKPQRRDNHSQYATASNQLTDVTGSVGRSKSNGRNSAKSAL